MPPHEIKYRKLPGHGSRGVPGALSERTRLWLADDHILQVMSQAYSERYRRFYFRDIQAIVVCRTRRGLIINLALLLGFLLSAAIMAYGLAMREEGTAFLFGIPTALLLAGLVLNAARGPTCVCRLQTAVQTEELPSLDRLWTARKVLRILKARIEETQGALPRAEIAARFAEAQAKPATAAAETPPRTS